jgi:hypothetical protein
MDLQALFVIYHKTSHQISLFRCTLLKITSIGGITATS